MGISFHLRQHEPECSHYGYYDTRTSERVHSSESSFLNILLLVQPFKGLMNIGR